MFLMETALLQDRCVSMRDSKKKMAYSCFRASLFFPQEQSAAGETDKAMLDADEDVDPLKHDMLMKLIPTAERVAHNMVDFARKTPTEQYAKVIDWIRYSNFAKSGKSNGCVNEQRR